MTALLEYSLTFYRIFVNKIILQQKQIAVIIWIGCTIPVIALKSSILKIN